MEALIFITDIVEKLILLLMFGLSVWSISIMIDRKRFLSVENQDEDFAVLKKEIAEHNFSGVEKICSQGSSFLKRALTVVFRAGKNPEFIDRALISHLKEEKIHLEKGLVVLGTLGANAPFIGLFGTVLGIIRSFAHLGSQSGSAAVMSGVSQALYATAMGLFVAIPAVIAYNIFSKKIKDLQNKVESLKDLYISKL
ncbi:MAG: MotA/TolQ/ExbB proton channel family protein [Deltaproteobacteria bacterium]|nr:MotA/TolQ/ExbB proton channel family protein [Deltaproteobacteria bacterium]